MTRLALASAAILLVLITAPAVRLAGDPPAAADAEFAALVDRYYAAWNTLDVEQAGKFYAQDPGLVFFDITPMRYVGWGEYKAGAKANFIDKFASGKLTPHADLQVTRRGDVAWTTLTFHLSAKRKDGTAAEFDARHTAIWEKRGGQWLVVHEHVSVPTQG